VMLVKGASVNLARADEPYVLWAKTWPNVLSPMAFGPAGDLYVVAPSYERTSYDYTLSRLLRFNRDGRLVGTNNFEGVNLGGLIFDSSGNRYLTGSIEANGFFDVSQVHGFFV